MKATILMTVMAAALTSGAMTDGELANARKAFAEQRFGIFIHWGLYALYAQGEWYQLFTEAGASGTPRERYSQAKDAFYPANFDARRWAREFKDAGARYVTFTSRHHEGFSMFASKFAGGYDIAHTPFGRDICKELADACHAEGLQINFYYSLMDWWRTDYPVGEYSKHLVDRKLNKPDYASYRQFMLNQIGELLSDRYQPVGCIWLDGDGDHPAKGVYALPNGWEYDGIYDLIHSRGALIGNNNNQPTREKEDIQFFEMTKSAGSKDARATKGGKPCERCFTMQKGVWGYKLRGDFYKPEEMVAMLVRNAAKGVNLLLNIGPRADGEFSPEVHGILREMGRWLKANGEAIYATDGGSLASGESVVSTTKGEKTVYLHFIDPSVTKFAFTPAAEIASATSLAEGSPVRLERTPSGDAIVTIDRAEDDVFTQVVKIQYR